MNTLSLYNIQLPVHSYTAYKNYILSFPSLTESEEKELLIKYKFHNCLDSVKKIILSNLKNVFYIAQQYKNYGLSEEDLTQEGTIGLMKAVKNFDISENVRLYTYAILWIKAEIQNYIINNWKIVKIATTNNFKKLFFNFRKIQQEMIHLGVPKKELESYVANKLNVKKEEVLEAQNYFNNDVLSIEYEKDSSDSNYSFDIKSNDNVENFYIENIEEPKILDKIKEAILLLNDKQQKVLKYRFFTTPQKTHKEISTILNISSERVRQIENESIQKLKSVI